MIKVNKINNFTLNQSVVFLINNPDQVLELKLSTEEKEYVQKELHEKDLVVLNKLGVFTIFQKSDTKKYTSLSLVKEAWRKAGNTILELLNKEKVSEIQLVNNTHSKDVGLSFLEGFLLSNYQFLNHFSKKEKNSMKRCDFLCENVEDIDLVELIAKVTGTFKARDLVNEPYSHMDATILASNIKQMGEESGCSVEVFDKEKIESLKMGGLLAVNKGSLAPPSFSIMEWKPEDAKNNKPIVFVGKGVVYDTGGLSLKPTAGSMDEMKADMGGGAAAACAVYAIALAKLPYHVVAIVPATDNRPGGEAYAPGDVITMHNGKTVEVLNTDAEGRMLLADALSYAKQLDPELVFDLATLTGSAVRAVGTKATVMMGTAGEKVKEKLLHSGDETYERLVEFPFWEEYGEEMKSDIADLKNLGGPYAGAITAGKFLEHFAEGYPWLHLDIAGPAYLPSKESYRPKYGTGVGVRMLFDFVKNY